VLSPSLRQQSLDLLLRRPVWIKELLAAVETKRVTSAEIGRQRFANGCWCTVTCPCVETARRLLATADNSSRTELVTRYLSGVTAVRGDAQRVRRFLDSNCAVCHKLRGEGQGAAPDLASVVDRSPETQLIAILDPNRACGRTDT
jgi:hypothetical protein